MEFTHVVCEDGIFANLASVPYLRFRPVANLSIASEMSRHLFQTPEAF